MMLRFLLLAALGSLVGVHGQGGFGSTLDQLRAKIETTLTTLTFDQFAKEYNLTFATPMDRQRAEARFNRVVDALKRLDADKSNTFVTNINWFAALREGEEKGWFGSRTPPVNATNPEHTRRRRATTTYTYVDYNAQGKVTSVKNQAGCGSCYAFAGVAALESAHIIAGQASNGIDYSDQQVVDCSYNKYPNGFNYGCNGGHALYVAQFFNSYKPVSEASYPYREAYQGCKQALTRATAQLYSDYIKINDENYLAYLLNKNGPIPISLSAGNNAFQYYAGGVINNQNACNAQVDHAVLLTGIKKESDGTESWIIKNSWGAGWGERGYVRLRKGSNMCNMVSEPVVPVSTKPIIR